jgi:outer membrane lipoprotein LolB
MRALLAVAPVLLLAGCVSGPRHELRPADPAVQRRELQQLQQFSFEGRLAAAVGSEGFNADLNWKQQGARSTVDLRAPLGFGSARVVSDDDGVKFTSSRGENLTGADAIAELERRLGFAAPIGALRYWILGVADPARPATEAVDADGRLSVLEQDGWRVEYGEYRSSAGATAAKAAASAPVLPRRVTLSREQIRLRLVVNRWVLSLF